jgi:hypothetical protein
MIQLGVRCAIQQTPSRLFLFVTQPTRENRYQEMVVVHVQVVIVHPAIIRGEI